jgi:hypothetical protein
MSAPVCNVKPSFPSLTTCETTRPQRNAAKKSIEPSRRRARGVDPGKPSACLNRLLFEDRLPQALARMEHEGMGFALMTVDLCRFKDVNDSYGQGSVCPRCQRHRLGLALAHGPPFECACDATWYFERGQTVPTSIVTISDRKTGRSKMSACLRFAVTVGNRRRALCLHRSLSVRWNSFSSGQT